jgi:hypothetical protein
VYEDCCRDLDAELGPDILAALAQPLSLVLQSARWLTHQAACRARELFRLVYAGLVAESGSQVVEFIDFWFRVQPYLLGQGAAIAGAIFPALHARWEEALGPTGGSRQVELTSGELRERVAALFAAPGPGWPGARYHSPDVMVCANGSAAMQRGEYRLVLGELHLAVNTLNVASFVAQHPDRESLERSIDLDLPGVRLSLLMPKDFPGQTARTHVGYLQRRNYFMPSIDDAPALPPERVLFPAAMVIEEQEAPGLVVRTRDGRLAFDLLETFSDLLAFNLQNGFGFLEPRPHSPRITIDRLVVCRESWSVPASELAFCGIQDGADRFLAARRWQQASGLPRFAFLKSTVEPKPLYVDFESPIYVDIFAKVVRRTAADSSQDQRLRVTEMLPRTDETWLPDARGERYTSELRIVAVDQAGDAGPHAGAEARTA